MTDIGKRIGPWEHCPDCGAVLVTLPGMLYCSCCGFDEELVEEAAGFHARGRERTSWSEYGRTPVLDLQPAWPLPGRRAA